MGIQRLGSDSFKQRNKAQLPALPHEISSLNLYLSLFIYRLLTFALSIRTFPDRHHDHANHPPLYRSGKPPSNETPPHRTAELSSRTQPRPHLARPSRPVAVTPLGINHEGPVRERVREWGVEVRRADTGELSDGTAGGEVPYASLPS